MIRIFTLALMLGLFSSNSYSEEYDDFSFDLESEFGIKQKSTVSNFPLKEIGQEELSNAAIGGALQATSTNDVAASGKPAFSEQEDKENKQRTDELDSDMLAPTIPGSQIGIVIPNNPHIDMPAFKVPDGRVIEHHSFEAFERP